MGFIETMKSIGNFFKSVGSHIYAGFVKVFGKEQTDEFFKTALGNLRAEVVKIAVVVCKQLMAQAIAGTEKKAIAFTEILAALKASGLSAANSEINLAIELVVAALKNGFKFDIA